MEKETLNQKTTSCKLQIVPEVLEVTGTVDYYLIHAFTIAQLLNNRRLKV